MVTDLLIPADLRKLTPTQAAYEDDLLALPNVVGVALGHKLTESGDTGTPCVQVLVDMKVSPDLLQPDEIVPMKIGATPTDVIEVGLVEACSGSELTPSRARDWAERYCEKRVHLPDVTDLRAVSPTLPRAQQVAAANSATRARAAIGGIGTSERNPTPQVGDILGMSGRAGDHTAPILGLNATIAISYSSGRIVRFAKQIITSGPCPLARTLVRSSPTWHAG
ncbi:hypothetical protein [Amycolatopsis sp. EV170708-02-1]|uniref:hypothetical protein n=1 Tax=Amycolatopsis sp. EV170708-02-1 TaxID=2919322 RepID=UPI001F0B7A52|nr:hypothetical protein [Amycolatopsis sp. EV170708-02-1]UMP06730.1 hypothetical protein MJQ72_18810 [Amycolatopsis sp. EV170708-02-1]